MPPRQQQSPSHTTTTKTNENSLGHESSTEEMTPRELPDALLRRRKTDEDVRIQHDPAILLLIRSTGVASLDVPPRRNVDGHDRQAGARYERERDVERGAHGRLERKAKDGVQDDVARGERRRERRLG